MALIDDIRSGKGLEPIMVGNSECGCTREGCSNDCITNASFVGDDGSIASFEIKETKRLNYPIREGTMEVGLCPSCIHKNVCKFTVTFIIAKDGKMIDDTPLNGVIKCTHYIEAKEGESDV